MESKFMSNEPDYFGAIGHDWNNAALAGLRAGLLVAYSAVKAKSNPNTEAEFSSPNGVMVAGVMRWMFVDYHIEKICKAGLIPGIEAHWINLGGGVHAMELRGKYTSVMAFHLNFPDSSIRDSRLRFEKRLVNQLNPIFPQWATVIAPDGELSDTNSKALINLVLVHGGKEADFAYLRAYHDPEDLHQFISVSPNIIDQSDLKSDFETIQDIEPELHDDEGDEIAAGA